MSAEELPRCISFKNSLHQAGLLETLAYAEMLGKRPETVVIGVEPADISPWGLELTETLKDRIPDVTGCVLREIEQAGGWYRKI
jgi:hydrogenase maturation protease